MVGPDQEVVARVNCGVLLVDQFITMTISCTGWSEAVKADRGTGGVPSHITQSL
jgi:hypothetical protein